MLFLAANVAINATSYQPDNNVNNARTEFNDKQYASHEQKDIYREYALNSEENEQHIIRYYDIPVFVNTALAGISGEGGFSVRVKEKDAAEERLLAADSCILSVGYVPARQLADDLLARSFDPDRLHVIGDAREVGNLMSVIWEAYALSYRL